MFLSSAGTKLEENKTSDKAKNSAEAALAPIAEAGIRAPRADTQTLASTDRRDCLQTFIHT